MSSKFLQHKDGKKLLMKAMSNSKEIRSIVISTFSLCFAVGNRESGKQLVKIRLNF